MQIISLKFKMNRKDYMQLLIEALSEDEESTIKHDNLNLDEMDGINLEKKLTYNVRYF